MRCAANFTASHIARTEVISLTTFDGPLTVAQERVHA